MKRERPGMLEGWNENGECSPRNRGFELSECLIIGKKMRIAGGIKRERPRDVGGMERERRM